jgi:hypothetical protein
MAKAALFQIPADLELFTQLEAEQILHCGKTKRQELTRDGKLVVANVAGKHLVTGRSIRSYLAECATSPTPSGRSLSAKQLNRRNAAARS